MLHLIPVFTVGNYRLYDFFLRFLPRHKQIDNIVFLNVDDPAIAAIGVFPWPRSVMADGLLRLKEHGAQMVIIDIEYIDKSPTQVDEIYLRDGLARDYNRHFSEISTTIAQVLNAVASGRIPAGRAASYIDELTELIAQERDILYANTLRLTSDDDRLLAQAASLFGNTWGTLNLQEEPLTGEQAQRRPIAEERFSYPVANYGGITEGRNADILIPIPEFASAVKGAGFTNINPDPDGVRRRISLVEEVHGNWYLQLAFAPLMEAWDNPEISIYPRRLVIDRQGEKIVIPLDKNGSMLLEWPLEDYYDSYDHISFYSFSLLDSYLANIAEYLQLLSLSNNSMFPVIVQNAAVLQEYFWLQKEVKQRALDECSGEVFEEYINLRDTGLEQIQEFIDFLSSNNYIENESNRFIEIFALDDADLAQEIMEEAKYSRSLLEFLDTELNAFFDLNQRINEKLNNKIVIIGRTDTGTTDISVNPFHSKYINLGTHAVVFDMILSNSFITPLPALYSVLFAILFVPLVLIIICGFKPGLRAVLCFIGVVLALCLPFALFFFTGMFLAPLSAVLAMAAAAIVSELTAFAASEQEKRYIRRAFSTYLSPNVVAELIADPSKLNLGGEKKEITVLFTDLKEFSVISEMLEPDRLVQMLNKYLTKMSNIIMENNGTIDKYIGDAIIAFFGAPIFRKNHAELACRSALAIKEAESELNAELLAEGFIPMPLYTRIGINTGKMVVGNMGSEVKMDYTVMGNEVNLTSRLEGLNKQYKTSILISEVTKNQTGSAFLTRQLDHVRIVGIHKPFLIYELSGTAAKADKEKLIFHGKWKKALMLFKQRQYKQAAYLFKELKTEYPDDGVTPLYLQRCINFLKKPPEPGWNGIFAFTEK